MSHLHTNSLIHESSPYLLQHAHNPVDWHPWSEEALKKALQLQKPILVSIGYAACHWCHVMEKESFEDEVVAAFMNEHFINIKIDREERPDIDHIYMDAVQAMTGSGGWPLNAFLNPEGQPFYGGTYFPPKKAFNRPSWMDVLASIAEAWGNKRDELYLQAKKLTEHLESSGNIFSVGNLDEKLTKGQSIFNKTDCTTIAENILKNADLKEGGFGNAPKFPQTFSIIYLLQHGYFFDNKEAIAHAKLSLQKMLNGGIYDQLAGGISRYSTDTTWLIPHFEKMLYDNALLIIALSEAWQLTREDFYLIAIDKTVVFILSEMEDKEGGFYAALDADSEGVEGKFYVWTQDEINELLGVNAALFSAYYNVSETGNWEYNNILHIKRSLGKIALEFSLKEEGATEIIDNCKKILMEARAKRIRPQKDDKILLGWNALAINAFCKAYICTGNERYKKAAEDLFVFIEKNFFSDTGDSLHHTYKNGKAKYPAFLDDYAFLIDASIQLQEISSNQDYLIKARKWTFYVLDNFSTEPGLMFYYTRAKQKDIIVRKQEIYDGALPSSNAIMAKNLLYLGRIFDVENWVEQGQQMLLSVLDIVKKHPGSFGVWAQLIQQEMVGINEIVVTGAQPSTLLKEVLEIYIPNKILQSHHQEMDFPLLRNKSYSVEAKIYLCKNYQCQQPVSSKDGLVSALKKQNY
ncbi:MAG: thioredoxin domain-containing protein [Ferruginibacter sp.]